MRVLGVLLGVATLASPGCVGIPFALLLPVEGTFSDSSTLGPFQTGFAVYDRYQAVTDPSDGSVSIQERDEGRVTVFLSAASFDPFRDLASLSAQELENLRQDVRTSDLVVIRDLGASRVGSGRRVSASTPPQTGEFNFLLRRAPPNPYRRNPTYSDIRPLGSAQKVVLEISTVTLEDLGRLEVQPLTLEVGKGPDQTDGVTTGEVRMRFNVPFIPERLGESNLAVLEPALD